MKQFFLYLLIAISFNLSAQTIDLFCGSPYNGNTVTSTNNFNINSYSCYNSNNSFNAGDDFFRLNKNVSGDLVITLFSNNIDHDIFLLVANGEFLQCYNANSYSTRPVSGNGLNSELIVIPNAPLGIYYIVVDGALPNDEGFYTLTATCGQLNCSFAENIDCGETKTGHSNVEYPNNISRYCNETTPGPGTGCTGSERVYQFTLTETSDVSIDLHPYAGNDDFELFLLNTCNDEACRSSSTNGTGMDENITVSSLSPGTYYIVVDGWRQTYGQYNLSLTSCSSDPCSNAIPISCGEPYSGTTAFSTNNYGANDFPCYTGNSSFSAGDEIFVINKTEPGDLVITLFSNNVDLDIFLFDECTNIEIPNRTAINGLSCYSNTSLSIRPINPSGLNYEVILASDAPLGEYYIIVDGHNSQQEGSFVLTATCGRLNCSLQEPITCGETKTAHSNTGYPNDVSHYCNDIDPRNGGGCTGPERIYSFTLTSEETISINLHPYAGNDDLDLFLLNSCNDEFCRAASGQAAGVDENIDVTLDPGTYYIIVDGWRQTEGFYDLSLECCTRPELPSCLNGVTPPCEDDCDCVEPADSYLPLPFQCETFNNYVSTFITPQSNFWSLETGQADAKAGTISVDNKALRLMPIDGVNPGVLYNFYNGSNNNLQCGRYRISWDMKVENDKSAGFRVLYDKNENVTVDNMAIHVFLSGGNGNITIWDDNEFDIIDISFNYLQGTWIKPMFIIDLDNNQIEFWLNEKLVHLAPYDTSLSGNFGDTVLGAITFFGDESSDFLIDNICARAAQTPNCPAESGEKVCVRNGETYDNACQAAQAGLYIGDELEICITICDYPAEFIGRNDGQLYTSGLVDYELAPNFLYTDSSFAAVYGDFFGEDVPFPLYTDAYIFENEDNGIIDINFNSGGTPAFVVVYQCVCDETGCSPVFIGERQDPIFNNGLPAGIYYIIVVNNGLIGSYGISVFPNSDCGGNINAADILSCGESITDNFSNAAAYQHNGSISSCYQGNRAYNGNANIYRIEVDQASIVDIEFNTTGGAGGAFLFASACGGTCLGYTETSIFGGAATIENATLASGFNYLIVFEETTISSYTLNVTCQQDIGNLTLVPLDVEPGCVQDFTNAHEVRIDFNLVDNDAISSLSPVNIFTILGLPPSGNNNPTSILTGANVTYQEGETATFSIPRGASSPDRCSLIEGDTIALMLSTNEDWSFPCRAKFRLPTDNPSLTADSVFMAGGLSEIIDYIAISTGVTMQIMPNTFTTFTSEASNPGQEFRIIVSNEQEWTIRSEQSWIHFDSQGPFNGVESIYIQVDEWQGFEQRIGQVIIETTQFPVVSKNITVTQLPPCITPTISFPNTPNQIIEICEGESATFTAQTGFDNDNFNFYWNDETSPSGNSRTFNNLTVETHHFPLLVEQKSCLSSTVATEVTIIVSERPSTPQLNTTTINSCSGNDAFFILQPEDGITYSWRNTSGNEVQGLSFTPGSSGDYTVYGFNTQNNSCFSSSVNLTYTLIENLTVQDATNNHQLCLGDEIELAVSTNLPASNLNFNWSNGITQNAATVTYQPQQAGNNQLISVEVQNEGCPPETLMIAIDVFATPTTPLLNDINIVSCGGQDGFVIMASNADFNYIWKDENGTMVHQGTSFTPTSTGNFTLQAFNAQNGQCSSSIVNLSYTLIETLTAEDATEIDEICLGEEIILSVNTNLSTVNFNWDHDINQNASTVIYQPTEAGAQTINVEITNAACPPVTVNIPIQVNSLPPTPEVVNVEYCEDNTAVALSVTNATNQTTRWYTSENGDMPVATGTDFTPTSSGIFWVELEANDCVSERISVQNTIGETINLSLEAEVDQTCLGNFVSINANASGNPNNYEWSENVNGLGSQAIFAATIQGENTIELTASNGLCTASSSINIDVGAANIPSPTIDNPDLVICEGDNIPTLLVGLNNTQDFTINWYASPSGNDLLLSNSLSYTPTSLGTYYAETVDLSANICTSNTRLPVTITDVESISLNIAASDLISCEGTSVVLNSNAQGGSAPANLRYIWSDGISQGATFTVESTVGNQEYTVMVTDVNSPCENTASISIQGVALPISEVLSFECISDTEYQVLINTDANTVTTFPETITINDLGNGMYQFTAPTEVDFEIMFNNEQNGISCSGAAIPVLAPICECLNANIEQAVPIDNQTTVDVCFGEAATLEVQAPSNENFIVEWYNNAQLEGAPIEVGTSFTQTIPVAGIYYAIIVDPITDCTSSLITPITLVINNKPTANAGQDETVCRGDMIQLNGASGSSGADPLMYDWSPANALSQSNTAEPILQADEESTTLTLVVTDIHGCTDFDQVTIQTTSLPQAEINELQSIDCYGDQTGQLEAVYTGEFPQMSMVWSTGETESTIDLLGAGTYTLTVIDMNGCEGNVTYELLQAPVFVLIDSINDSIIIADGVITNLGSLAVLISGATPPYQYEWFNNNGELLSTDSVYHTDIPGTYEIIITDKNGCMISTSFDLNLVVGLSELTTIGTLNVFPNPTNNNISLEVDLFKNADIDLLLLDALGQQLESMSYPNVKQNRFDIEMHNQPAGIYWLQIIIDGATFNRKIIKVE